MAVAEPYTAYLDDSGTEPKPTTKLVVAAYCVAPVRRWKKFESAWRAAEKKYGFQQFHMTEFASCRPDQWCRDCESGKKTAAHHPWREWSNTKRRELLHELTRIVCKYTEHGAGIAVPKDGLDQHVHTSPVLSEIRGTEHLTFAVQTCGQELGMWEFENRDHIQKLKFVFDLANKAQAAEIATKFVAEVRKRFTALRLGDPAEAEEFVGMAFESRKTTKQLLAADMLAWTTAKVRSCEALHRPLGKEAKILACAFLRSGKLKIGGVSEAGIAAWAVAESKSLREEPDDEAECAVQELRHDNAKAHSGPA